MLSITLRTPESRDIKETLNEGVVTWHLHLAVVFGTPGYNFNGHFVPDVMPTMPEPIMPIEIQASLRTIYVDIGWKF